METSANDSQVSLITYMSRSTGINSPHGTLNSEAFGLRNDGEFILCNFYFSGTQTNPIGTLYPSLRKQAVRDSLSIIAYLKRRRDSKHFQLAHLFPWPAQLGCPQWMQNWRLG